MRPKTHDAFPEVDKAIRETGILANGVDFSLQDSTANTECSDSNAGIEKFANSAWKETFKWATNALHNTMQHRVKS